MSFTARLSDAAGVAASKPGKSQKPKKKNSKQLIPLNLLPGQLQSVYQLASEGSLDQLKATLEGFLTPLTFADGDGRTLLHAAASTNQVHVMQYLLENGVGLDSVDDDGNTALHVAVMNGHIEALHLLLGNGAKSDILNANVDTPLHIVAQSDNAHLMAAILEHPVDFFTPGYRKRAPIHTLAMYDNLEVLKVYMSELFKHKPLLARLTAGVRDEDGLTAVHLAARKDSHKFLDYALSLVSVVQQGIPLEQFLSGLDEENCTPLHAAVDCGCVNVMRVFLKYGANPLLTKGDQPSPLHLACSQGKIEIIEAIVQSCGTGILFEGDHRNRSAVHYGASAMNGASVVAFLVRSGANVNSRDCHEQTAIHNAVISGSLSTIEELLSSGADPLAKDIEGLNPLHYAVKYDRKTIVVRLLVLPEAQHLVTDIDSHGNTPVHCALKMGLSDIIAPLLSAIRFQHSHIVDQNGNNYLHLAASAGSCTALAHLLDDPSSQNQLNHANHEGITPLHCAAKAGSLVSIRQLLSHGAMSHKGPSGMTPFLTACSIGQADCVSMLHKAHPYQRDWTDREGSTALHFAATSRNAETVTLALDLGVKLCLNFSRISFLDQIIENMDANCAMAVVKHLRWQECLDFHSPAHPHPMLGLTELMPDVALTVLDRCHTKALLNPADKKYWERFDFKYLQLDHQSEADVEDEGPNEFESLLSNMGRQVMNYRGLFNQKEDEHSLGKSTAVESMQCLTQMVHCNRVELLTHPVTVNYLRGKWKRYGRSIYLSLFYFLMLQVIFLSVFILIARTPSPSMTVDTNISSNSIVADANISSLQNKLSTSANALRYVNIGLNIVSTLWFILIAYSMRLHVLDFITNGHMWVHCFATVCTFVFLIPSRPLWVAGSLAVFFAWFRLAMGLLLFDVFGMYISMFLAITRTVFRVLLMVFFLLAAFALPLYILINPVAVFPTSGHFFLVTFGYLLGELNYETVTLESGAGNVQYSVLVFMYLVTMSILLSIVMANLLIGLAVGDIAEMRFSATVATRSVEVGYFSEIDKIILALPKRLSRHFHRSYALKYPNAPESYLARAWKSFWKILNYDERQAQSYTSQDVIQELTSIRQHLRELSDVVKSMHEMHCELMNHRPHFAQSCSTEEVLPAL